MTMTLDGSSGTTFPAGGVGNPTSTVVGISDTQTLTNKTLTSPTISSPTISGTPVMSASVITLGTAVASTSGTSVDFTGIPSWVKRITVMLNGISTNGTSNFLIQIGTSGGIQNTGYVSYASVNASNGSSTAGFVITAVNFAASLNSGIVTITLLNNADGTWVAAGSVSASTTVACSACAGIKTLSGTLDRVRITSVTPDTFDAGSINIQYE